MTTTDEAVALVDSARAAHGAVAVLASHHASRERIDAAQTVDAAARTAVLDLLSAKDAEIERLTKERDEAANDRDCFIEGKVLAEHQRDAAEATITELRKALEDAHEALRPFAKGAIDVSGSAVIIGYPEASEALRRARAIATEVT